jgi:integrase
LAKKMVLTDRYLKALRPAPEGKRAVTWDAVVPGFGVRTTDRADDVGKASVRTFLVVKRRPGERDPVTHVVGHYNPHAESGDGTLAHARDAARAALADIVGDRHPDEAAAERRRAERRARRETFREAVEAFLPELKGLRTADAIEATLRREFLGQERKRARITTEGDGRSVTEWKTAWADGTDPVWRDLAVASIARRDVVERLDQIKRERGKHAARNALAQVRKMFNWAAEGERFGIDASPCSGMKDRTIGVTGRDLKRKRVLSDEELHDLWKAAMATAYPFGPLVRLLMLNGQRFSDVACARWPEVVNLDGTALRVPGERFKNNDAHEVPLTPKAAELISELPRFKGSYIFTTTAGRRPISGISKMKARLDRAIAKARKEDGREAMPHWILHDLRRTLRTRLVGDCGVDAFIAERVIGHALPGLHGVYDQGTHRAQKREALQRWEARLLSIVEPKPSAPNVVRADEVERRRKRRRA